MARTSLVIAAVMVACIVCLYLLTRVVLGSTSQSACSTVAPAGSSFVMRQAPRAGQMTLTPAMKAWLASHPDAECEEFLTRTATGAMDGSKFVSQTFQDAYLYVNMFYQKSDGFYLDVGANHYKAWSNTYFFDKCLGWKGICIEVNPAHAEEIRAQRTCEVVNTCILESPRNVTMDFQFDATATVGRGGNVQIPCQTVEQVLSSRNIPTIDLLSLDIEGSELLALKTYNFERWPTNVMLVETFYSHPVVRHTILDAGFMMAATIGGADEVFVRTDFNPFINVREGEMRKRNSDYKEMIEKEYGCKTTVEGSNLALTMKYANSWVRTRAAA
jgi:FkbM family methyltransferase